jgi:hypothetical protein
VLSHPSCIITTISLGYISILTFLSIQVFHVTKLKVINHALKMPLYEGVCGHENNYPQFLMSTYSQFPVAAVLHLCKKPPFQYFTSVDSKCIYFLHSSYMTPLSQIPLIYCKEDMKITRFLSLYNFLQFPLSSEVLTVV